MDAAVRAAREAFPGWRATAPQKRARAVMALREALWANQDRIARLVTEDMGKTLADARGEVLRGIESTEAACGIPHLLKGENLEGVATGVDVELVRQPVGVVRGDHAVQLPGDDPALVPALRDRLRQHVHPQALGARPAPVGADLRADRGDRRDPGRGLQPRPRRPRRRQRRCSTTPGVDAISFVGQASTARYIAERSAQTGKRCQALGGAKNSLVVMPDADLETTVPAIMSSSFGAAGQRCLAGSVAVVVGDGRAPGRGRRRASRGRPRARAWVPVTPRASRSARWSAPRRASASSAPSTAPRRRAPRSCSTAASASDGGPGGTLLGPTIVETSDPESEIARDELFGPLLTIVRAADLDEALEFVNGSRYGNAGSIFTGSGEAARRYRYDVQAGMLGVNVGVAAPVAWFPFSGWKDSIDGDLHANGADAVEFYTRKKVVTSRW